MKLKDCIKFTLIKVFRNSKNCYLIIVLMVCSLLFLGANTFRNIYFQNREYDFENLISYRKMLVFPSQEEHLKHYQDPNYDYGLEKVLDIDHVLELYDLNQDLLLIKSEQFFSDKHSGEFEFAYGSKFTLPSVTLGKNISETDTGVAICPMLFYPSLENKGVVKKTDYLKDEIIGKIFTIKEQIYKNIDGKLTPSGMYEKDYKIVGLYDSQKSKDLHSTCYISSKDMSELYDTTFKDVFLNNSLGKLIVVDKFQNVDKVAKEIVNMGFRVEPQIVENESIITSVNLICIILCVISIITIIFISYLYIKKKNNNDSFSIGILKSLGFNNNQIQAIIFFETLWLTLISLLIGYVLFEIVYYMATLMCEDYLIYSNFLLYKYSMAHIYIIPIIIIFPLLINYFMVHLVLKKKSSDLV